MLAKIIHTNRLNFLVEVSVISNFARCSAANSVELRMLCIFFIMLDVVRQKNMATHPTHNDVNACKGDLFFVSPNVAW